MQPRFYGNVSNSRTVNQNTESQTYQHDAEQMIAIGERDPMFRRKGGKHMPNKGELRLCTELTVVQIATAAQQLPRRNTSEAQSDQ